MNGGIDGSPYISVQEALALGHVGGIINLTNESISLCLLASAFIRHCDVLALSEY
jgi:hypothetical protein